jgi:hypothetical protein
MVSFSDIFGQESPEDVCRVLPAFLNKKSLFEIYNSEVQGPKLSYSSFCDNLITRFGPRRFDKNLPWIKFSVYTTHSKCDTCSSIERYARNCKSKEELDFLKGLKYMHREKYAKVRIAIGVLTRLSLSYPKDYVTVFIDSMDNMKGRKIVLEF